MVGWGPTIRELDHLATRFAHVRHVAFLHPGTAPDSEVPYAAANIELVPVRPSGGSGLLGKLDVLRTSPGYVAALARELAAADVVHVRAPASIALLAMAMLRLRQRPAARWFKYAGNWRPQTRESRSYTLQRWWLARGGHRGIVTVNGTWPGEPAWVRPFFNPSLDAEDLVQGREAARAKKLTSPILLLFVGALTTSKGAARALEVLARVRERGIDARLELVGGGEAQPQLEQLGVQLGVASAAWFVGWVSPNSLREHYRRAHFLVLPSATEGWPKVLSEGMAYGVVPIASAVSAIPQQLAALGCGVALPHQDVDGFAAAISAYVAEPKRWAAESARATSAADSFSFEHYLRAIDALLDELVSPSDGAPVMAGTP